MRLPAFASLLACAVIVAPSLARAEYLPPQKSSDEAEVVPEGEPAPPRPGKRRYYLVEVDEPARPERHVTLTLEPLELLYPIYRANVEVKLLDTLGLLVTGGFGQVQVDSLKPPYDGPDKVSVWLLGPELLWYATGDFDTGGMHVGLEALYVHAKLQGASAIGVGGFGGLAPGLSIGPLIGWKLVTRAGFTFDTQIGVGLRATKQTSGDPLAPKDDRGAILLGSLAIGWTF